MPSVEGQKHKNNQKNLYEELVAVLLSITEPQKRSITIQKKTNGTSEQTPIKKANAKMYVQTCMHKMSIGKIHAG